MKPNPQRAIALGDALDPALDLHDRPWLLDALNICSVDEVQLRVGSTPVLLCATCYPQAYSIQEVSTS